MSLTIRRQSWARKRSRGYSLVEMLGAAMILAFVSLGTVMLYRVGDKTQRTARFYSDAQSQVREALRRVSRTVRHANGVVTNSLVANFSTAPSSDTTQVIVETPAPASTSTEYIRFYLNGTTLYAQRHDDTDAGIAITSGVQSMTVNYYYTTVTSSGISRTRVNGAPTTATEVQITLVLKSGTVTTTENVFVELRNHSLGLI